MSVPPHLSSLVIKASRCGASVVLFSSGWACLPEARCADSGCGGCTGGAGGLMGLSRVSWNGLQEMRSNLALLSAHGSVGQS